MVDVFGDESDLYEQYFKRKIVQPRESKSKDESLWGELARPSVVPLHLLQVDANDLRHGVL
jgi:hypothetical protein